MGHTYTSTLFHIVFSTKERQPSIAEPAKLWAYLAGIARNLQYKSVTVGGIDNHVHVLLQLPANVSVSEAVRNLKSNSSRWLGESGPWSGWQEGYGAFSVSASNQDAVRRYIQNQPTHHRQRSFEDEFAAMVARAGVDFNRTEMFD